MNKRLKIILSLFVVILIVLFGWYGIARQNSRKEESRQQALQQQEPQTGSIKIGAIMPLTGDMESYGESSRNVLQLAIDEMNVSGGVHGRKIDLIIEDGKCNEKDATNAMQKLANVDQVKVVIGGFCNSESLAAAPIAEKNKIALFSPGSSSPDLTGKSPFFARVYPSDASQGVVLALAATKRGWKKVAFVEEQLDYPASIYKSFSGQFEKDGGTTPKEEFATTTTDFQPALTRLRAQKPDALFIDSQSAASGERVLKEVKELKWNVPLFIAGVFAEDAGTVLADKDALEGALTAQFSVDQENEKFKALLASYKEKYGIDMPFQSYAQAEYDAAYLVRDALLASGEDGEKIALWLRSVIDWQGDSGSITIGSDGDRVGGTVLEVIKGGKSEAVKE